MTVSRLYVSGYISVTGTGKMLQNDTTTTLQEQSRKYTIYLVWYQSAVQTESYSVSIKLPIQSFFSPDHFVGLCYPMVLRLVIALPTCSK